MGDKSVAEKYMVEQFVGIKDMDHGEGLWAKKNQWAKNLIYGLWVTSIWPKKSILGKSAAKKSVAKKSVGEK